MQNHLKIVIISDIFYHKHTCCIIFHRYLASFFEGISCRLLCIFVNTCVESLTFRILFKYNFERRRKLYGIGYLKKQYKKRDRHLRIALPVSFFVSLYYFPTSTKLSPSARVWPSALMVMLSVSRFSQNVFATACRTFS